MLSTIEKSTLSALLHRVWPSVTRAKRLEGIEELSVFMAIKVATRDWSDTLCSPSLAVTKYWEALVLATELYASYCRRVAPDEVAFIQHRCVTSDASYLYTYNRLPPASRVRVAWWPKPSSANLLEITMDMRDHALNAQGKVDIVCARTNTVAELRKAMDAKHVLVTGTAYRLFYNGDMLEDAQLLSHYIHASPVTVILFKSKPKPATLQLFIKRPDGTALTLHLPDDDTTTVRDIKSEILHANVHIPADHQMLYWRGDLLLDNETLKSLNIPTGAELKLCDKEYIDSDDE